MYAKSGARQATLTNPLPRDPISLDRPESGPVLPVGECRNLRNVSRDESKATKKKVFAKIQAKGAQKWQTKELRRSQEDRRSRSMVGTVTNSRYSPILEGLSGNHRPHSKTSLISVSEEEAVVFEKLTRKLQVASNLPRLQMLEFCKQPRKFSEIMRAFRMNPASLKHHGELLQSEGLLAKRGTGRSTRYETTPLGERILSLVTRQVRRALST